MPITHQQALNKLDQLALKAQQIKELQQTWKNTEEDYLKQIEALKESKEVPEDYEVLQKENTKLKNQLDIYKKGDDWETKTGKIITDLEKEVSDLETEKDEAIRDKKTLEQQVLAQNNQLKNKQQEVSNKEKALEELKKEKSASEIALNEKLTEKNELLSQRKKQYEELEKRKNENIQIGEYEEIWNKIEDYLFEAGVKQSNIKGEKSLLVKLTKGAVDELADLRRKYPKPQETIEPVVKPKPVKTEETEYIEPVDICIEPVEIEGKERSETRGMMTQLFFDLIITVSERGVERNEGPHIIGDAWTQDVGTLNIYDEDTDTNPGSLINKKVKTIIIPNAGESKKDWVGNFNQGGSRNSKIEIKIKGAFEKYDESTLTLTFKSDRVELEGILESASL